MTFTATCNECQFSGTIEALKLHDCHIQQMGGQCEDFPACGHTDGDGCQTLPEHTADYWNDVHSRALDMGYSLDEIDMMYDYA